MQIHRPKTKRRPKPTQIPLVWGRELSPADIVQQIQVPSVIESTSCPYSVPPYFGTYFASALITITDVLCGTDSSEQLYHGGISAHGDYESTDATHIFSDNTSTSEIPVCLGSDPVGSEDPATSIVFPRPPPLIPPVLPRPSIPEPPPPLEFQFYQPGGRKRWASEPPDIKQKPKEQESESQHESPVPGAHEQFLSYNISGDNCSDWDDGWYM